MRKYYFPGNETFRGYFTDYEKKMNHPIIIK